MRQTYVSPAVVEYGSIADCTFVTPAVAKKYPSVFPDGAPLTEKYADGDYVCLSEGDYSNPYAGEGGKNYLELKCDKFGEFSHGDGSGS